MKKAVHWIAHASACYMLFISGTILAASDDITMTPTGTFALEAGQIKSGYAKSSTGISSIEHVWQQDARLFFGYDALYKQKLHMKLTAGGLITFSTPQLATNPVTTQAHYIFYIDNAYADYSLGKPENLFCKFQLGLFPYKYNPDVRNLGEYLFRTLAYPLIVYSEFDNPKVNLLGARINFQFADKLLENDLLFHSELLGLPVQDWSISDILSSTVARGAVTLGVGGSLSHFFSVYQGKYPESWSDYYFYPQNIPIDKRENKVGKHLDSAYIDWKSVRVMGRISIDPKPFIPLNIFGKNDLKLYGEIDAIGLKNYPYRVSPGSVGYDSLGDVGYDSLSDRVFYVFGFNFPGFKFVDIINTEFEFCANRSAFSDEQIYGGRQPNLLPVSLQSDPKTKLNRALWRWSVYVKKSFMDDHFNIIAQAARDHKKVNYYYWDKNYMSFMEALPTVRDWWWSFKTEFKF